LRELYGRISDDPQLEALTISEAHAKFKPQTLERIFPGSWINANFDIWIGSEEDNLSWEYLLKARRAYDDAKNVPEDKRKLAFEELLIAEGAIGIGGTGRSTARKIGRSSTSCVATICRMCIGRWARRRQWSFRGRF
jgi:alpha-amylase/alpha-mannosidase (GH57 family)